MSTCVFKKDLDADAFHIWDVVSQLEEQMRKLRSQSGNKSQQVFMIDLLDMKIFVDYGHNEISIIS